MNYEVLLRRWGNIWWVRCDGDSTTATTLSSALMWATMDMDPGDTMTVQWGPDIPEDQSP